MAYRDPLEAARQRVAVAQETVDSVLERMRPELMARLPKPLRGELERLAGGLGEPARQALEQLQNRERSLIRYGELLDEALSLAPDLEQSFNRLPVRFPGRVPVSSYVFADVYHHDYQRIRAAVHEALRSHDPDVTLFDAVPRYFDFEERPFLVEATFRFQNHPMRLQAAAGGLASTNQQSTGVYGYVRFQLVTSVRQSTPKLRLSPEGWSGALWAALRLTRDVQIGQEVFDKTFLVDAGEQDAARAFTPQLCEALLRVAEVDVPSLVVHSGQALLEWQEPNEPARALPAALEALRALRELDPIPLLVVPAPS